MAKSYYKSIGGKNFDRKLLAIAETATPRKKGKPLIELELAKKLVKALLDGNEYTDVEKKTMKYIRDNYAFTKDADVYLRTEVRKFAARKARSTKKESVPKFLETPEEPKGKKPSRKQSKSKIESKNPENSISWEKSEPEEDSSLNQNQESSDLDWDSYQREREEIEQRELYYNQKQKNLKNKQKKKQILLWIFIVAIILFILFLILWRLPSRKTIPTTNLPTTLDHNKLASESTTTEKQKPLNKESVKETPNSLGFSKEEELQSRQTFDEFAREPLIAAPIRRFPVDKTNPKSSIRYINSLEVTFVRNQETLTKETKEALQELAEVLKTNPNFTIRIEGHTCWIGTKEENQKLSEARANLVRDYLVEQGVPPSQLQVRGYGETQAKDTNRTKEGRQRNRRVEFSVLSIQGTE